MTQPRAEDPHDHGLDALRRLLEERKEAIRERLLTCLADHVEAELNDLTRLPGALGEAGAAGASAVPARGQIADLRDATERLTAAGDQVAILEGLIQGAIRFAGRAAVFVCRDGQAVGWGESGFAANPYSMAIRGVTLSLAEDSALARVVARGRAVSGGSAPAADQVWSAIGAEPSSAFAAVPVMVQGRVAAVLFVDGGTGDVRGVETDALFILARMAEMRLTALTLGAEPAAPSPTVETVDDAPPAGPVEAEGPGEMAAAGDDAPAAAVEPARETSPAPTTPEPTAEVAPASVPDPEPSPMESTSPPLEAASAEEEAGVPAQTAVVEEPPVAPADGPAPGGPDTAPADALADGTDEDETLESPPAAAPAHPVVTAAPVPEDADTPLHEEAKRFARLLVSEILLYNPEQVQEGKEKGDLYDRLRKDLERSEQMYRQRVAPSVAESVDYFQEEVVRTLAGGDPKLLGL